MGNKADAERQVSEEEITQFAQDKNLIYYETSAKTGANVKDMFIGMASTLTERTPIPAVQNGRKGTSL